MIEFDREEISMLLAIVRPVRGNWGLSSYEKDVLTQLINKLEMTQCN
jgi:hypothetical protein